MRRALPAGICFVLGIAVRTRPGLSGMDAFGKAVLDKAPGYAFVRGMVHRPAGRSREHRPERALVEIEEAPERRR